MNYFTKKALHLILFGLAFTSTACATDRHKSISIEEIKQIALQECLDTNYIKANLYSNDGLKDRSYLTQIYALDNSSPKYVKALHSFVEEKTGQFYKAQVPLKDEEARGPFNRVFSQCMNFYHSKDLDNFIKKNILPERIQASRQPN